MMEPTNENSHESISTALTRPETTAVPTWGVLQKPSKLPDQFKAILSPQQVCNLKEIRNLDTSHF